MYYYNIIFVCIYIYCVLVSFNHTAAVTAGTDYTVNVCRMCRWDRKTPTVTKATDTQLCVLISSYNWSTVRGPNLNSGLPTRDEGSRVMVTCLARAALGESKKGAYWNIIQYFCMLCFASQILEYINWCQIMHLELKVHFNYKICLKQTTFELQTTYFLWEILHYCSLWWHTVQYSELVGQKCISTPKLFCLQW